MKWLGLDRGLLHVVVTVLLCSKLCFGESPFKPDRVPARILPGGWREYNLAKHVGSSNRADPRQASTRREFRYKDYPAYSPNQQRGDQPGHSVSGPRPQEDYSRSSRLLGPRKSDNPLPSSSYEYHLQRGGISEQPLYSHEQGQQGDQQIDRSAELSPESRGTEPGNAPIIESAGTQESDNPLRLSPYGHQQREQSLDYGQGAEVENAPVDGSSGTQGSINTLPQSSQRREQAPDAGRYGEDSAPVPGHSGPLDESNPRPPAPHSNQRSNIPAGRTPNGPGPHNGDVLTPGAIGYNNPLPQSSQRREQAPDAGRYGGDSAPVPGHSGPHGVSNPRPPAPHSNQRSNIPAWRTPNGPGPQNGDDLTPGAIGPRVQDDHSLPSSYHNQQGVVQREQFPSGPRPAYQQELENRPRRGADEVLTRVQRSSAWSDWSLCNATCGVGYVYRQRACSAPSRCNGNAFDREFRVCNSKVQCEGQMCGCVQKGGLRWFGHVERIDNSYSVQGGWCMAGQRSRANWTPWGQCNSTCDKGFEIRQRLCPSATGCRGSPFEKEYRKCEGEGSGCSSSTTKKIFIITPIIIGILGIGLAVGFFVLKKKFGGSVSGSVQPKAKKPTKPKTKGKGPGSKTASTKAAAPTPSDEPEDMAPEPPPEPDYVDVAELNTDIVEEDEAGYLIPEEEIEEADEPEEECEEEEEEEEGEPQYVEIDE